MDGHFSGPVTQSCQVSNSLKPINGETRGKLAETGSLMRQISLKINMSYNCFYSVHLYDMVSRSSETNKVRIEINLKLLNARFNNKCEKII